MRNLFLLCAAATTAAAVPATSVNASPLGRDPAPEVLAFCQTQVAADPSLELGTCMSYFLSGGPGYLTQFCHYLDDTGQLDEQGITFAECVREIRQD